MTTTKAYKILVVDDNPDDTFMTKRALTKAGFGVEVETAAGGEAALELLRNGVDLPSLILLDLKMPGMSGTDTLRLIRNDESLKNITVIILTNSTLESDKNGALAAGADGFLQKASDFGLFCGDIKAILERWLNEGKCGEKDKGKRQVIEDHA
jgi:hypothetical protein